MNTTKVAIVGSGNIGCDLAERLLVDSSFEIVALVGRNSNSPGLERFKARIPISSEGIEGLRKYTEAIEGIFDASSAQSAVDHWHFAKMNDKWLIDLTPSQLGTAFVPSIAGQVPGIEIANELSHNYSMVTCGGQTSAPIVHAMTSCMNQVNQIEVSSSIAAKSAGIATRNNINEYIEATEKLLSDISNCKDVKAILILNPSIPPVHMRTTVTISGTGAKYNEIHRQLKSAIVSMKQVNPGYELVGKLFQLDSETFSVTARVSGAGYFLPSYAGNLDIVNAAAVVTARMHSDFHRLARKP
jgi:acetaldehyde dehydrogenase (acetylating)